MFQYFIKIVPTTYKGSKIVKTINPNYDFSKDGGEIPQLETNRYFTTERFTPLMLEIDDENWKLGELVSKRYKDHHANGGKEAAKNEEDADDDYNNKKHKKSIHADDMYDDYYDFYNERQEPELPKPVAAGAKVGGNSGTSHHHHEHHRKQQSILPGIFFIYQVYPFAVEISKEHVPLTHLFIRILSTIGGVFTIMGMIDTVISTRNSNKSNRQKLGGR